CASTTASPVSSDVKNASATGSASRRSASLSTTTTAKRVTASCRARDPRISRKPSGRLKLGMQTTASISAFMSDARKRRSAHQKRAREVTRIVEKRTSEPRGGEAETAGANGLPNGIGIEVSAGAAAQALPPAPGHRRHHKGIGKERRQRGTVFGFGQRPRHHHALVVDAIIENVDRCVNELPHES